MYLHFSCAIWAEMAGVAGADIDADKSATLDGYRVCQVKPRAAPACLLAYKNHLFYPAHSSAIEKEDDSMAHYGTHSEGAFLFLC